MIDVDDSIRGNRVAFTYGQGHFIIWVPIYYYLYYCVINAFYETNYNYQETKIILQNVDRHLNRLWVYLKEVMRSTNTEEIRYCINWWKKLLYFSIWTYNSG